MTRESGDDAGAVVLVFDVRTAPESYLDRMIALTYLSIRPGFRFRPKVSVGLSVRA